MPNLVSQLKKAHYAHLRTLDRLVMQIHHPKGVPEMLEAMAELLRAGERLDEAIEHFRRERRRERGEETT
jgi:hypothetical protein